MLTPEDFVAPKLGQVEQPVNRQQRRAIERHPERHVVPIKRGGVVIGYPTGGQPMNGFVQSLIGVLIHDASPNGKGLVLGDLGGGVFSIEGGPRVAETRTQMVTTFLTEDKFAGADWLLTIDDDMTFDPDIVERLVAVAEEHQADVVGGLCFAGGRSTMFPTIYRLLRDDDGKLGVEPMDEYPRDAVVKVGATGTGCMLIRRETLVRLCGDHPHGFGTTPNIECPTCQEIVKKGDINLYPWFVEGHTFSGGKPLGEDIAFCIRVNAIGGSIYVDTSIKVGHLKTYEMNEALWDDLRSKTVPVESLPVEDDGADDAAERVLG